MKRSSTNKIPLLLTVIFLFTGNTNLLANVKLPAIFSDKMILQQRSASAIWGWAEPGEKITISADWNKKQIATIADSKGQWKLFLQTPKAGGPYTITVSGKNMIEIKEVLIGEVWVCSGQSNMVYSLKADADLKTEIQQADLPEIRYFSVNRQYGPGEFEDCPGSVWEKTSAATAPGFSAVAYYFAKKINHDLNVPVGIIYAAWGGTPAEAWTPAPVLKNDTLLYRYIDRWKKMYLTVGKDSSDYHIALDAWEKARKTADSIKIKKPGEPATLVWYDRPWREPAVLFNGMIAPVIPYTIKGVLWYQGESNVNFADEYYTLFSKMINGWRQRWDRKELPFYFVQIAPFGYSNMDGAARLRDAQYQVMQKIPNTGMAVTIDVGDMKDQHFTHKKPVGERLALIALAKNYGGGKIIYKGPACKMISRDNDKLVLDFGNSTLDVKGETLKGFEIGYHLPGTDSIVYKKAVAILSGNKVMISFPVTEQPIDVRYAWLLCGEANLFNQQGLPAFPFRKKIK